MIGNALLLACEFTSWCFIWIAKLFSSSSSPHLHSVVWSALVLELILELIVRPKGYSDLIQSDRAFSPSTARHISRFHIVFESIALVTYIPEFRCIGSELCESDSVFSRVALSLDIITGESQGVSARGRFLLGLTVLRLFGPIRHWKQMFINVNLSPSQSEGPHFDGARDSFGSVNDTGRSNKKNDVCTSAG